MGWEQGRRTSRNPAWDTPGGLQEAQQVQAGWSEAVEDGQHGVARVSGSSVEIVAVTPCASGQDLCLPVKRMKDISWSDDSLDKV